jgi:hypothetical protein
MDQDSIESNLQGEKQISGVFQLPFHQRNVLIPSPWIVSYHSCCWFPKFLRLLDAKWIWKRGGWKKEIEQEGFVLSQKIEFGHNETLVELKCHPYTDFLVVIRFPPSTIMARSYDRFESIHTRPTLQSKHASKYEIGLQTPGEVISVLSDWILNTCWWGCDGGLTCACIQVIWVPLCRMISPRGPRSPIFI